MEMELREPRLKLVSVSGAAAGRAKMSDAAKRKSGGVRWLARRWDLIGVLALLGSSAACSVFLLTHLGL